VARIDGHQRTDFDVTDTLVTDTGTLFLSQQDVIDAGATDVGWVSAVLEQVFKLHQQQAFTAPPSSFLKRPECPHVADRIIGLSAHVGTPFDREGMKWIASSHINPRHGLPRANAVIILNDPVHRLPIAIMEGALISAMRTAVVQALAARYLARADSESVGLVGAGRIGALTLWAISKWFPNIQQYRAYDQSAERLSAFVEHMASLGVTVEAARCFQEALAEADMGIVATTESEPYVTAAEFKAGSLFMNVSLMDPTFELVSAADKIVVDDWHQSVHSDRVLARMHRAGLLSRDSIHGEFGEVVAGHIPGRAHPEERIFWNPFGLAIEDIAVASAIYDRACERGLGQTLQLVDREWDVLF
jgi:2,3-diaminopropionate biosynthesis protein SbnB